MIVNVACFELPPRVAVMTALVAAGTDCVLTLKRALVLPAGTVTLDGTVAIEVLLLDRATTVPPEGALALSVTVPVELPPPVTLAGFKANDETVAVEAPGLTVKFADTLAPPDWAKIGAVQVVVVLVVLTVKLALVLPAGTVTGFVGKITGRLHGEFIEVDSLTALPPDGAGEAMVMVPVALLPAVTLFGLRLMDVTAMPGVMVMLPCTVLFPSVAVIVTAVLLRTNPLFVLTVKVALVAPAGTLTVDGTMAKVLLLLKPTVLPPAGAGALKVTVPVDG